MTRYIRLCLLTQVKTPLSRKGSPQAHKNDDKTNVFGEIKAQVIFYIFCLLVNETCL